jgi:hypothetical protein
MMRRRSSKIITTGVFSPGKSMVNIKDMPSPKLSKKGSVPSPSYPIKEEDSVK